MTMATRLTPIFALRQYMALMGGSGLLVAQVRSELDDKGTRWGWRVMPYWLEMDPCSIVLRPLGREHDEFLRRHGWRELRPWCKTPEEAWEDAQGMRYCAIPLSGRGVHYGVSITDQEAWEILQDLHQRLADLHSRIEWWESADALHKWSDV